MDEGFDIPIGGDLGPLSEAFDKVIATITQMGERIASALGTSNSAIADSTGHIQRANTAAGESLRTANNLGAAITTTGQKIQTAASLGANLGTTLMGVQSGLTLAAKASKILTGVNLTTALNGWITKAGGIRGAFAKIPAVISTIARNPVFQRIAIGAGVAIAGILAIRGAWKAVSGAALAMKSVALSVFRSIRSAASTTASAIRGAFSKITSLPGKMFGAMSGGLPIAGIVGAAGAVALLGSQLKGASREAATFEDLNIGIEHFTGSAEKAKALLDDLAKFAIATPFETIQVQQTAGTLLGAGIKEDVAGITKDLAAMSRNGQELGELGDALAKGFAKGKFQTDDINKFLERGINLNPALQAQLGLTGEAFTKAVQKGLSFSTVTAAMRSMSREGGQFFGLLERRSQSFNGLLSTLSAAWTDLRQAFGKPINDALKPILKEGIAGVTGFLEKAKALGERIGRAITIAFVAFKEGKAVDLFGAGLRYAIAQAMDLMVRGLRSAVGFLAGALPPIFDTLSATLSNPELWSGIGNLVKAITSKIEAAFQRMVGNEGYAESLEGRADLNANLGMKKLAKVGEGVDVAAVLTDALMKGGIGAKDAWKSHQASDEVGKAKLAVDKIAAELAASADKIQAETAKATALNQNIAPQAPAPGIAEMAKATNLGTLSTSQGRVGGGGFGMSFNSLVSIGQKTNKLLGQVVKNTAEGGKAIPVLS